MSNLGNSLFTLLAPGQCPRPTNEVPLIKPTLDSACHYQFFAMWIDEFHVDGVDANIRRWARNGEWTNNAAQISEIKLSVGYIDGYMGLWEAAFDDHFISIGNEDTFEGAEVDLECASGDRHDEPVVPNQHTHRRMG